MVVLNQLVSCYNVGFGMVANLVVLLLLYYVVIYCKVRSLFNFSVNGNSTLLWLAFFRTEIVYLEKLKHRTRVLGFMNPTSGPEDAVCDTMYYWFILCDTGKFFLLLFPLAVAFDFAFQIPSLNPFDSNLDVINFSLPNSTAAASGSRSSAELDREKLGGMLAGKDQFFGGAMPAVIYANAIRALPTDFQLRLRFMSLVPKLV